jgi:Tfp pilus assembly protein PilF
VLTGDLEGAGVAYLKAAERSSSAAHWEIVGELKARAGQLKDAESAWRNALSHGENAVVRVQLARLALRRGDRAAAELELEAALREAKGEERREAKELAGLLADLDRKPDALKLLAVVSAEPESEKDVALQLQAARLARELGDKAVLAGACARAKAAGAAACP